MEFDFKSGLYLGRFQPLHIGHTSIIDRMLKECKWLTIAIGSAQESGTERNPLSFSLRKRLIEDTYYRKSYRIKIIPINDREKYSDDSSWGDYLFDQLYDQGVLFPDAIYEGEENVRERWYDNYDVSVIKVPRTEISISGTELRHAILKNQKATASVYLPDVVYHEYYEEIRKEIQNAAVNSKRNPVD